MKRCLLVLLLVACSQTTRQQAVEPPRIDAALASELVTMRTDDQEVRRRWMKDQKNAALIAEVEDVDRRHVARLKEILATHGWPGKSTVGEDAASAAWIIAQHGGAEFLGQTLPLMYEAVKAGELSESLYATSLDRVLVQQGRKQMYGTQFDTDPATGKCEPKPIEDPDRVDERRIRAGLGPLADYQAQLCRMFLGK